MRMRSSPSIVRLRNTVPSWPPFKVWTLSPGALTALATAARFARVARGAAADLTAGVGEAAGLSAGVEGAVGLTAGVAAVGEPPAPVAAGVTAGVEGAAGLTAGVAAVGEPPAPVAAGALAPAVAARAVPAHHRIAIVSSAARRVRLRSDMTLLPWFIRRHAAGNGR